MELKKIIREIFESIFVIFTCAILVVTLNGHILGASSMLLRDVIALFAVSALTSFAGIVLYSKKEPKRLEMLARHALHLIIILAIVLAAASYFGWLLWSVPITVLRFIGITIIIWMSVHAVLFFQTKKLTDDLNKKLKERYKD